VTTPGHVAIVGASLAGITTARELRSAGYAGVLTLIGDEPHMPYDRPPLSKAFLGEDVDVSLAASDEIIELRAEWVLGRPATGLGSDADGRHAVILDDSRISADVVVLATGARARPLPGCPDLAGIHTLRTLDDAHRLRSSLARARRLVVLGAGFIGAEVASTARALGVDVTIVEVSATPLAAALGDTIAEHCTALHAANGVQLLTGIGVREIVGEERVTGVLLTDGTRLPADAVVVGIGAIPNTEWLVHPQIDATNGFRTDAHGRTGVVGVFAVGDCANTFDPHCAAHHRSEHWTSATTQARVVAAAITATHPLGASEATGESTGASEATGESTALAAPYFWSHQYGHQLQFAGYRLPTDTVHVVEGDLDSGPVVAIYRRASVTVGVFSRDNPRLFTRYRKQIERTMRETARDAAAGAAVHTAALEAGRPSAELDEDLRSYRRGHLDSTELLRRTTSRYRTRC